MTVTAYVMVKANTGDADRVRGEIEGIDGVEEAHIVAGDVDFVVRVRVDNPGEVKSVTADGILSIEGVENTKTYIAMN